MKKNVSISLVLLSALLSFQCTNSDEKIQSELGPALTLTKVKAEEWCKCVNESTDVNDCIEIGKLFNEERKKFMDLIEKNEGEHGPSNKVIINHNSENTKVGVQEMDCNGKFLERGGKMYW